MNDRDNYDLYFVAGLGLGFLISAVLFSLGMCL